MKTTVEEKPTKVPIDGEQTVTIDAGQPWPSAYRGSRYSIVSHEDFSDPMLKWEKQDLNIFTEVPDGLRRLLVLLGKSGGYGSIRVTSDKEILTKIPADDYKHVDQAPIDNGWIPVYVGKLAGSIDFDEVNIDPTAPSSGVKVWSGFTFNHGERWSVSHDGTLIWNWRDYRFESAFDHDEIVATYREYRNNAGRLYITEHGHIWINVPRDDIPADKATEVKNAIRSWKRSAKSRGDAATLRLVNRRLVATSRDEDPATGLLPIHVGHLSQFDTGRIPRAIVDDESYYYAVCEYETVWE